MNKLLLLVMAVALSGCLTSKWEKDFDEGLREGLATGIAEALVRIFTDAKCPHCQEFFHRTGTRTNEFKTYDSRVSITEHKLKCPKRLKKNGPLKDGK